MDESGRRTPHEIDDSEFNIETDFAIEALATEIDPSLAQKEADLKWTGDGLIQLSDERYSTSLPGVFAGGDVARGPALVVEAVADGKGAAQAITDYLEEKGGK